jgi:hypothetical protein
MLRSLIRFLAPAAVATALFLPAAPAAAAGGCPGQYLVYQPMPAGPLLLPAASYSIDVLNLSCVSASRSFESFLGREDLPEGWTVNTGTKTFFGRGGSFSVQATRVAGATPDGVRRCPSFSVLHGDRLGSVGLPRGQYAVESGGEDPLACLAAARLLVRAFDDPSGMLPPPWAAADSGGSRPGAVLRDPRGRSVLVRWLSASTAGGGHTAAGDRDS